ncbi:putative ubiquitin-conjugating enzyme E2 38 [Durio zibethinus]|uniref:Ubiquitin-conjugating enzyme E2 38 n=1 Tax=Durio zibethinus TaxID=66656 RepID=A0A6P6A7N1_DURZI|nr:putative ubiquitin-conjugating enzyme E2 38 [Durio zibethinus]
MLRGRGLKEAGVKFKQFDCVTDFSDHYYYCRAKTKKKNIHGKINDKSTVNRIMKEWEILEKHLPKSIYVRVYEERIDLLSAAIMGAKKTPYHHGLFFFDISFPSDYPNNPPKVRYHSFGLRLNPNLYSNGYVCLSLLNTWDGVGTEKWNPLKSTILQVLVSLQGLVLNEKPYYNEPGLKPWEAYNADVFTLSCKTMLFQLGNPLRNFEALIAAHFHKHGSTILRACIAYKECRVCIGFFNGDDANAPSSKKKIKVSKQFKNSMDKLYPDLFNAFNRIGAPLQNMAEKLVTDVDIQEKPVNGIISKLKTFWEAMTT